MKEQLIKLSKKKGFISIIWTVQDDLQYYFWLCHLQKWIREKKNVQLNISGAFSIGGYYYTICKNFKCIIDGETKYPTYETALEEGLKQSLSLIR